MFEINTDIDIVLTKDFLLTKNSEERYFSFYLGINPTRGRYYKNPLRDDSGAGCKFYRNKNKELVFFDFARNSQYSFVDIVMEKYNCSFNEALETIANDFNIKKKNVKRNVPLIEYNNSIVEESNEDTIIECETKEYSDSELEFWNKFGITKPTLDHFNVFSIKHVFLNGKIIRSSSRNFPIFGYYFGIKDGIEQWKIYIPLAQKGKRFLCNTKCLQGINKIQGTGEVLVVTKSYKDVMSLYEFGIPAISTQGESIILSDCEYRYFKKRFKYIVFNADWDRTGQTFMINSLKKFDGIALSFSNKKKYSKDFSDFICKFGKEKAKSLINYLNEKKERGFFDERIERNRKKFQKKI